MRLMTLLWRTNVGNNSYGAPGFGAYVWVSRDDLIQKIIRAHTWSCLDDLFKKVIGRHGIQLRPSIAG